MRELVRKMSINMKRLAFILASLTLILTSGLTQAVTSHDDYFSALCIEEQSTGFNWESNNWKRVNFLPEKYIVKKKPKKECSSGDDEEFDYGCYNIKTLGEKEYEHLNYKCQELWYNELAAVWCVNMNPVKFMFDPNGWFHKSFLHGFLQGNNDSLAVSVGKCTVI